MELGASSITQLQLQSTNCFLLVVIVLFQYIDILFCFTNPLYTVNHKKVALHL